MIRTAFIAIATAVCVTAITTAAAQPVSPVTKIAMPADGQWAVIPVGERNVSQCVMGVRSDAAAPQPGRPQFMVSADKEFVILRVRAADWHFSASRDIQVTLATAKGGERQPQAIVRGADAIDIAFGTDPAQMDEIAASGQLEIRTESTTVRLTLGGLADALPAYRNCLANVGRPMVYRYASAVPAAR